MIILNIETDVISLVADGKAEAEVLFPRVTPQQLVLVNFPL